MLSIIVKNGYLWGTSKLGILHRLVSFSRPVLNGSTIFQPDVPFFYMEQIFWPTNIMQGGAKVVTWCFLTVIMRNFSYAFGLCLFDGQMAAAIIDDFPLLQAIGSRIPGRYSLWGLLWGKSLRFVDVDSWLPETPQKKYRTVKSSDLAGQRKSSKRDIRRPGNRAIRISVVGRAVCAVAPSFLNHMFSSFNPTKWGRRKSLSITL